MATLVKQDSLTESLAKGEFDFSSDTLKVMLVTDSYTPSTAHSLVSDVSSFEVSGTNYTAGGIALNNVAVSTTGGVATVDADDLVIDKDPAGFSRARYVCLVSGSKLLATADLGSDRTNVAVVLTLQLAAAGLFTIS